MATRRMSDDSQNETPIIDALKSHISENATAFDAPGHQSGEAAPLALAS